MTKTIYTFLVSGLYQNDRRAADQAVAVFIEKYRSLYPTVIECLQRDLEACLTFYAYPKEPWKTIRTNNELERLFGEVKRRSHKMAAAFRMISAIVARLLALGSFCSLFPPSFLARLLQLLRSPACQ